MQLSSITEYLDKYRKKLSLEDDKRGSIIAVIRDVTGISVDESALSVTKGIIMIKGNAVVKNELFLHKERILSKIKESGRTDIFDIS